MSVGWDSAFSDLTSNGGGYPKGQVGPIPLGRREDGAIEVPSHITRLPEVVNMAEAEEPEPREYVVDGLVPEGAATSIYGAGGVAKSLLAMSLATAVAEGDERWLGRKVRGSAALYLDFELTADEQIRRAKALCRGAGYDGVPKELLYLSAVGHDSEAAFWRAYEVCAYYGVGLLVVDSYGLAMEAEAESASDVLAFFRNRMEPFILDNVALLMVDHQAKGPSDGSYQARSTFGSVYKRNTVRSEIQVEALDQDESRGTLDIVLRHTKHNFGPQLGPFGARLGFADGEIRIGTAKLAPHRMAQEDSVKPQDRVMIALNVLHEQDYATTQNIATYCNLQAKSVSNILFRLKHANKVEEIGHNGTARWRPADGVVSFTRSR